MAQKFGTLFLYALTLPNINRFSNVFHCQNQAKICNNTITKDPTTPQVCRYTTINCEMSSVLNAVSVSVVTIDNKTTSVTTTHFKKLTTANNVFIVSVIVYSNCYRAAFTSNVQCFRLAARGRTEAGDATDEFRDQ